MLVTVNLASKPFANLGPILKRLRIAIAALAVAAVGLGFGLHFLHSKAEAARSRERVLDAQIARINQERQGYLSLMQQPLNAGVLTEATALNKLFDEKAFSWTLAMEDLETVLPGGVVVTTLEPLREKDGHISLRLRVSGPRDRGVELIQNLEHSKRFLLPRIVGEQSEATGGPNERLEPVSASNRVNFDLLADYNPAKPGERKAPQKKIVVEEAAEAPHSPKSNAAPAMRGPGLMRPPNSAVPPPIAPRQARPPQAGRPQPGGPR